MSSDCTQDKACANQKCIDPCPGTCGINAKCQVINHSPICSCLPDYVGDPFVRCFVEESKKNYRRMKFMRLLFKKINFYQQRSRYLENLKIPAFHLLADHSPNVAIKIVNQCVLAYKIISVDRQTADQNACPIPNAPQTLHV